MPEKFTKFSEPGPDNVEPTPVTSDEHLISPALREAMEGKQVVFPIPQEEQLPALDEQ